MEPLPVTTLGANEEEKKLGLEKNDSQENQELTHPNKKGGLELSNVLYYQGTYFYSWLLPNIITFQEHFQPQDSDIIVASKPKSGTTWLKSLVFSILNRNHYNNTNHPLLTKNPHELTPNFEFDIYPLESYMKEQPHIMMSSMSSSRLFSTHLPYDILPKTIKGQSKCKIVYMARNLYDTVVSNWKFHTQIVPQNSETTLLEDYVENFCTGIENFGPHWDHVLGYWKESRVRPSKVLFLMYEDMQEDGLSEMKRLAEFLGYEFSEEEERQGVIHEILRLCSIDNMKSLEVNKIGSVNKVFKNNLFFRKGKVGDWVNHLSPLMVERLDQVMREKFVGSGLEVKMLPRSK